MPIVDARDLHKSFGGDPLLDGVDLTIKRGERVALVGLNGSGKSTLTRILCGLDTPDDGTVTRRRGARVAVLEQVPDLPHSASARQVVLSGLEQWASARERFDTASAALEAAIAAHGSESEAAGSALAEQGAASADVERLGGWEVGHHAEALLDGLAIRDADRAVGTMSGGEQRRVALARALASAPDLLVLDEPTNHLDIDSIEWLERYIVSSFDGALLLVTHDRAFLDAVAHRTIEIEGAKLYSYDGGYESYLEGRARRLEHEARAEANRQRFVARELEWLRRQPKARTGKQKARIKRAEAAISNAPGPATRAVALGAQVTRQGKTILELADLRVEVPGRCLVNKLTLRMTRGQRVGIIGPNGCGKSTLLRTILGERAPDGGSVRLGKNTAPAYLSQTREGLDEAKSVRDNVADDRDHVIVGDAAIGVHGYLARFLFAPDRIDQPVGALSGGERTRVALARLLVGRSNLVVLDEPTNDLDVPTISALEQMLLDYGGTALIVTHDRWFLDRVATHILSFEGDGAVVAYAGNYSTMRVLRAEAERRRAEELLELAALRGEPAQPPRAAPAAAPKGNPDAGAAKPKKLSYNEQRELEGLEPAIETAEARVAELEAMLANPAPGTDFAAVGRELDETRAEAERLVERWAELAERAP
ncbi:MAG: ABC-F family ATP-binding cassette domain-containing protein [Myxococcales bacterium]|nr:ABC-F family ATP-binding cassette domain-containing protein [Myxococcales bacterium]